MQDKRTRFSFFTFFFLDAPRSKKSLVFLRRFKVKKNQKNTPINIFCVFWSFFPFFLFLGLKKNKKTKKQS